MSDGETRTDSELRATLLTAARQRRGLFERLHRETTDAYRFFNGQADGIDGLAIDRYGDQLLVQSFRQPLGRARLDLIEQTIAPWLPNHAQTVYVHRGRGEADWDTTPAPRDSECREAGSRYRVRSVHRGQDPLLFLDLRRARRRIQQCARGRRVLNLFAYTCGVGVAALAGGAREVWNVDFASSALDVGRENLRLNALPEERARFVCEDVSPIVRQLAGLPIKGRGARRRYQRVEERHFDLVVLDPPTWARSPFGAVDIVRDYQSLFKPALLAVADGGDILCTNHSAKVDRDAWVELLERCAAKAGRPLKAVELLAPDEDFPSYDGNPPLKVAIARV